MDRHLQPIAVIVVGMFLAACGEDDKMLSLPVFDAGGDPVFDTSADSDSDVDDVTDEPEPLTAEDACAEGETRCVAVASTQVERCEVPSGANVRVTRWVPAVCEPGQICLDGSCGPFSCEPGRATCQDLTHAGDCNEDGVTLDNVRACPRDTLCRGGVCLDECEAARQTRSYIGCEYMVVELPNLFTSEGAPSSPMGVVVANSSQLFSTTLAITEPDETPSTILAAQTVVTELTDDPPFTVSSVIRNAQGIAIGQPAGPAEEIVIPPGGTAILLLERLMVPDGTSGVYPMGRRLTASRPVVVYQFNPFCCNFSFSNDASLLLPISSLGATYTTLGAPDWPELVAPGRGGAAMAVIAHTDTSVDVLVGPDAQLKPSGDARWPIAATGTSTVSLAAGQVLYLESDSTTAPNQTSRFSGTRVEATESVAAFSTHVCTQVPHGTPACDHLEQQLIPEDTWGRNFVLAPPIRRSEADTEVVYWRIVAGSIPTSLQLDTTLEELDLRDPFAPGITNCVDLAPDEASSTFDLLAQDDCVLATRSPASLEASQPVMVMGFVAGQNATGAVSTATGDPSMFLLPPQEQFRDSYLYLTPDTYAFNYMTAIVPVNLAGRMTLDSLPLDPLSSRVTLEEIPGSPNMLLVHVAVTPGAHRVDAPGPFGLLVYAYDQYVSFAYTGGLNLTKR